MDVRKYFDSIDHITLKNLLSLLIKDKNTYDLFSVIIEKSDGYNCKGIPIGNLTSQFFANHYLSCFDHYIKEQCHVKRYIRYMDDMLIFSNNKNELKNLYSEAVDYIENRLKLQLKPQISGSNSFGAPFLGFLIKPTGIYLQQKTKKRYKAKVSEIEYKRKTGILSEAEAGSRSESVTSHLLLARARNFRNTVLSGRILGI